MTHCYGMLGVGREDWPDTGSGAELYVVIGQAPRQLDRNIVIVGRVLRGIELLSSLPRGTGALGFYEKPEQRTPIKSQPRSPPICPKPSAAPSKCCVPTRRCSPDTSSRAATAATSWYIVPAGHTDVCNIVAFPVRDARQVASALPPFSCENPRPMGRIFEVRKHTMFARWDRMAKQFARISKDINMAVKAGGADANSNPRCAARCRTAATSTCPRTRSRPRSSAPLGKDATATNRSSTKVMRRTASRSSSKPPLTIPRAPWRRCAPSSPRAAATSAATGSVAFQFRKMGVFRLNPEGIDHDDLELYLIDHGLDEMGDSVGEKGEPQIVARCLFPEFGHMQEALEKRGIHPLSATHEYICTTPVELPEAQATEVLEMVDTLEQNDDVQNVYHSLV